MHALKESKLKKKKEKKVIEIQIIKLSRNPI